MSNPDVVDVTADVGSEQSKLKQELLVRIAHSESFRGAQMLQHLLLYLGEKGSSGEAGALKEYSIGVDALGRRGDFDPKIDPIVRVQIHRLRQKLKEYYTAEGASDPLILEIPKGSYLPVFSNPSVAKEIEVKANSISTDAVPEVVDSLLSSHEASARLRFGVKAALLLTGAFLLGVATTLLWMRFSRGTPAATADVHRNQDAVQAFWAQILGNDSSPIIAYPDAVFLLDESNDLFRYRQGATDQRGALVTPDVIRQFASNPALASKAGQLYYENGYTGTGELESVSLLSGLFARMGVKPIIKSSRDITTADLKQHTVILLGSPFQNRAVAQLRAVGDFAFENPDEHRELWRGQILNLHPATNEAAKYQTERDARTGILTGDYGLITVLAGVAPGVHIAILGGLDTTGTQGATSFAVSPEGVAKMKDAMASLTATNSGGNSEIKGFQALLKVNLEMGYQVLDTQMLALHGIKKSSTADLQTAVAPAKPSL